MVCRCGHGGEAVHMLLELWQQWVAGRCAYGDGFLLVLAGQVELAGGFQAVSQTVIDIG